MASAGAPSYAADRTRRGIFFDGAGMRRSRRSRTKEQLWACARLALVTPAAPRAVPPLPPEGASEGFLIGLRQDAGIPRIAATSSGSEYNGIDVQAIRNSAPMRYARTLYGDGGCARTTPAANDHYCGMVARDTLKPSSDIGGPRDSILRSKGRAGAPASSSAGGGGAAAPWGILALLAARVIRAPWGRERAGARSVGDRRSPGVTRAVRE
jgi:hypothetical protein